MLNFVDICFADDESYLIIHTKKLVYKRVQLQLLKNKICKYF